MAGTTFSDHLGQKHYKKSKKSKIHADLGFQTFLQSLWKNPWVKCFYKLQLTFYLSKNFSISKALFKYVYLVGETKVQMNQSLFYIYYNCTV